MMSRIGNSIPLRRIQKVCRGLRYLAYKTFCRSTTFEGMGGNDPSKTLACRYRAVLQKIGPECNAFLERLHKFCKAMVREWFYSSDSNYFALETAKLTQDHSWTGYYCSFLPEMLSAKIPNY